MIWSRLPTELIREIIVYLASTDIAKAGNLRLVSRDTNVWVLPYLFRSLTFTTPDEITRFTSILLPKRKFHIPALKSKLHIVPRALSSYSIESLALMVNTQLPSVENALASVAPAFSNLKNLYITSRNLTSNAYWLRQYPIHPTTIVILHFGFPHHVNYQDPIFQCVTHLYTSTLVGYRNSQVTDLPQLTHLAVHTRLQHSPETIISITTEFRRILESAPHLLLFVFTIDKARVPPETVHKWEMALEPCKKDCRFILLPHFHDPRMEWEGLLRGQPDVWDRALTWLTGMKGDVDAAFRYRIAESRRLQVEGEWLRRSKPRGKMDWEIDMVQREDFKQFEEDDFEAVGSLMFHS
ncbi:hypothetical protein C0992_008271 [Termitomyces sp. T32_za158]|nr:hypothetical protein C0992_008271 [Termitomyces sp. T32_za158]